MSKKVIDILMKEVEACETKTRELLKERADIIAAIELFDSSVKIDDMTVITGKRPKKRAVETVAIGNKADKVTRRPKKYADRTGRVAVSGSALFDSRVDSRVSKRIITKSLFEHLIKIGYLTSKGGGQYNVEVGGKHYMKSYEGAGVKFYTDTFDKLIDEVGFKYPKITKAVEA